MQRSKSQVDYWRIMAAMILGTCLWMIWTASFWYIQSIEVRGASIYTDQYVQDFLKSQNLIHKHILQINPLELKAELVKSPLVKDAKFEREILPTRLTVKVQERQAAFLVYQQIPKSPTAKTAFQIIDHEGVILPLPQDVIDDKGVRVRLDPKQMTGAISQEHMENLRQLDLLHRQKHLETEGVFDISDLQNLKLYLPDRQLIIWLGDMADIPHKVKLIEPVLKAAEAPESQIQYVDLRYWHHPVVKQK